MIPFFGTNFKAEDIIKEDESDSNELSLRLHIGGRGDRWHSCQRNVMRKDKTFYNQSRPNVNFAGNEDDDEHYNNNKEMPFAVLEVSP